jgi:hypothetical protein
MTVMVEVVGVEVAVEVVEVVEVAVEAQDTDVPSPPKPQGIIPAIAAHP